MIQYSNRSNHMLKHIIAQLLPFFWQKAYVKIFQTSYERDFTTKKWIIIFGSHLINIFGTTCPDVIEIVVNWACLGPTPPQKWPLFFCCSCQYEIGRGLIYNLIFKYFKKNYFRDLNFDLLSRKRIILSLYQNPPISESIINIISKSHSISEFTILDVNYQLPSLNTWENLFFIKFQKDSKLGSFFEKDELNLLLIREKFTGQLAEQLSSLNP